LDDIVSETDNEFSGWDYRRAIEELWRRSRYERGFISDPFGNVERAEQGMRRIRALLAALGDPQRQIPTVHIAGSKGKGSTAAFTATAAQRAGHRVGLFTSPHLHRFPERIAIDLEPMADDAFASVAAAVARAAAGVDEDAEHGEVSTFELITAMAFLAFAQAGCGLAVIEVGLGGRYDATNVLEPVVSVITRIDLEHMAVLGPTYEAIATQKAGILRPGIPAVSSPQVAGAATAIASAAAEIGAPLLVGGRDWTWEGTWRSFDTVGPWGAWRNLSLGLPGPHQLENACTALAALHVVDAAGIHVSERAIREGFAATRWPGRFERVEIGGRDIVLDGAHTPAAAAALVRAWREAELPAPATVIVGMGGDKDAAAFLRELRPLIGRLIVTRADSPRAADPSALRSAAAAVRLNAEIETSVAAAIGAAERATDMPLLIAGSLFVAAEAREALGLARPDPEWQRLNRIAAARPPSRDV
jgi:dihydrofolate synthase/folylpolyglutamate synthase